MKKWFFFVLSIFLLGVLIQSAEASYSFKVILKYPFASSYQDSLGIIVSDSLVRCRPIKPIIFRTDAASLYQESVTNDSGYATFTFDKWADGNTVEHNNIFKMSIDFPNTERVIGEGEGVTFEPLRFDTVDFPESQGTIEIQLPRTLYIDEFTIGDPSWINVCNFAIMNDMHIGSGEDDFANPGWNDLWDHEWTDNMSINSEIIYYNIRELSPSPNFLALLGDISQSAESSELFCANTPVLSQLPDSIPYVPIMGNHDGWPYITAQNKASIPGDCYLGEYFYHTCSSEVNQKCVKFANWTQSPYFSSSPNDSSYYLNSAFDFQNYTFCNTDFNTREGAINGQGTNGHADTNTWTMSWLRDKVNRAIVEKRKLIILNHHPLIKRLLWFGCFTEEELEGIYYKTRLSEVQPLACWFGGHVHGLRHDPKVGITYVDGHPLANYFVLNEASMNGYFGWVRIYDKMKVTISHNPTTFPLPVEIEFATNYEYIGSENAPSSYYWDFGDNVFSTGPNPTHIYHPGTHHSKTYKVTSTVITSSGSHVTTSKQIIVRASPYNLHTEFAKEDSVKLAWSIDSDTALKEFRIWRDGVNIADNIPPESTHYIDTVTAGDVHNYEVDARFHSLHSPKVTLDSVRVPWVDAPSNLGYIPVSLSEIRLYWMDNSNREAGFKIARKINNGPWDTLYATVGPNIHTILDTVWYGNTYHYKIRAYDSQNHFSNWSNVLDWFSTFSSNCSKMTAFNNASRMVYGGGYEHLAYSGTLEDNNVIYYTRSDDMGVSWQIPEVIRSSQGAEYPALALDHENKPFILFEKRGVCFAGDLWLYISYLDDATWCIDSQCVFDATIEPEPSIEPYSLFIHQDTAYIVAVDSSYSAYSSLYCWKYHPSSGFSYPHSYSVTDTNYVLLHPSITFDASGRIIIALILSSRDGWYKRIFLHYKDSNPNSPWSSLVGGPNCEINGLMDYSIAAVGNNLYIAAGTFDWVKVWKGCKDVYGNYIWGDPDFSYLSDGWGVNLTTSPVLIDNANFLVWSCYSYSPDCNSIFYNRRLDESNWGETKTLYYTTVNLPSFPQACVAPSGVNQVLSVVWTESNGYQPYWIRNLSEKIPVWRVPANNATGPNNGELLTVDATTGNIHTVFNTGSTIAYTKSTDKGETWSDVAEIDSGASPSIVLDSFGLTRISYVKNDTVFCKILKPDSTWKTVVIFGYNQSWKPKEPAIAPSYPPELANYSYSTFSTKDPMSNSSKINLSFFDINSDVAPPPNEVTSGESLNSPAIAITPGDYLHITWEDNGEIFYRTSLQPIDPAQPIEWSDIHNVSESPEVISEHPVIEAYGENIIVAWKEGEPGEIYRRIRNINSDVADWSEIENISQSPNNESDYPVLSTIDVVAWQEKVDSLNWEISAWIKGDIVNLSETENSSKYPHIAVEPQKATGDGAGGITIDPKIIINAIWTEEITPESLYEVKFRRYEHNPSSDKLSEYIAVAVGDSTPSSYCESRAGFVDYGEFSCDYSSSPLLYNLPYLNPKSNYALRAVVYREGSGTQSEEMYVDTTFVTEVVYTPYVPETVCVLLPKETYENDLEVSKEIERVLGSYALLADLKIYEVSLADSSGGGGGAQGNRRDIRRYALYQNCPNPFKDLTKIAFALPRECKVSLFVYNVTGRRVRTLIDEKMKPGNYNLKWDGRDSHNRNLGQGIYFYRLQTEDFKDTKKTILLK